jgi:hypothetical protein
MLHRRTLLLTPFVLAAAGFAQTPQDTFEGVKRVVAMGDIHGDYPRFVELLRTAQLINTKNAWIGGNAHLVLTGDYVDRGPDSAKVMDLLMDLEPQAQRAGGRVHALLGNHEAMNIYGDLRYVTPDTYKTFQQSNSKDLREAQMQAALEGMKQSKTSPVDVGAWRKKFEEEHPLGWVEQRMAFLPEGKYGKWLRQKNAIVKINDAIFLHGGISTKYAGTTRQEINEKVRAELTDFNKLQGGIVTAEDGPLWYRGLAQDAEDDAGMKALVDQVLKTHQVGHIVIGHTPMAGILPRFGGKVITIDVGLSKFYGGPPGPPAFLVLENSKYYAVHRGRQLELPVNGGSVLEYLGAATQMDPPDSQLRKLLAGKRP